MPDAQRAMWMKWICAMPLHYVLISRLSKKTKFKYKHSFRFCHFMITYMANETMRCDAMATKLHLNHIFECTGFKWCNLDFHVQCTCTLCTIVCTVVLDLKCVASYFISFRKIIRFSALYANESFAIETPHNIPLTRWAHLLQVAIKSMRFKQYGMCTYVCI